MDDYEVDLIDYLRVIWWGKWIIIACFVVAVAVSAAIMWTRPNE
ncbi:LPS O-antigen length regulator, partial [Candidatus Bipolaricaulota bacterium]|nr:LPS O-antigen length regulator [Candidatus Bipolaricaulota bacterium]